MLGHLGNLHGVEPIESKQLALEMNYAFSYSRSVGVRRSARLCVVLEQGPKLLGHHLRRILDADRSPFAHHLLSSIRTLGPRKAGLLYQSRSDEYYPR